MSWALDNHLCLPTTANRTSSPTACVNVTHRRLDLSPPLSLTFLGSYHLCFVSHLYNALMQHPRFRDPVPWSEHVSWTSQRIESLDLLITGPAWPPPTLPSQLEEIRCGLTSCIKLSPCHVVGATEVTGACCHLPPPAPTAMRWQLII